MPTSPADRLLTLFGDEIARACLRELLDRPRTQRELAHDLDTSQSAVSRSLALLRAAGWVDCAGLRGASLTVSAPDVTRQLFLAADHLAQVLLDQANATQRAQTRADRRQMLGDRSSTKNESA